MAINNKFARVPFHIESDGTKTLFLPELKRAKGYQVGAKGSENYFMDYWEALNALNAMDTPRFRRPNAERNWGIVACKPGDVDEVSISHLQSHT